MITLASLKAKEKFDDYLAACNVHPRLIKESTQDFWKEMLEQKEELGDGLYELILMACNEVEQTKKDPCTLPKLPLDVLQLLFTKEKAGELVNSFKLETRLFTNTRASGKYKILQALATSPNRLRLLGTGAVYPHDVFGTINDCASKPYSGHGNRNVSKWSIKELGKPIILKRLDEYFSDKSHYASLTSDAERVHFLYYACLSFIETENMLGNIRLCADDIRFMKYHSPSDIKDRQEIIDLKVPLQNILVFQQKNRERYANEIMDLFDELGNKINELHETQAITQGTIKELWIPALLRVIAKLPHSEQLAERQDYFVQNYGKIDSVLRNMMSITPTGTQCGLYMFHNTLPFATNRTPAFSQAYHEEELLCKDLLDAEGRVYSADELVNLPDMDLLRNCDEHTVNTWITKTICEYIRQKNTINNFKPYENTGFALFLQHYGKPVSINVELLYLYHNSVKFESMSQEIDIRSLRMLLNNVSSDMFRLTNLDAEGLLDRIHYPVHNEHMYKDNLERELQRFNFPEKIVLHFLCDPNLTDYLDDDLFKGENNKKLLEVVNHLDKYGFFQAGISHIHDRVLYWDYRLQDERKPTLTQKKHRGLRV